MKSSLIDLELANNYYQIPELEVMKSSAYNAFFVEKWDNQSQLHLVPKHNKIGAHSQRIYDSYHPFGLKHKRWISLIKKFGKNVRIQTVVYEEKLSKDLLNHTFNEQALRIYMNNIHGRSYKSNLLIYYSKVNRLFANFRILTNFFESIFKNFVHKIQSIVYPTSSNFYSYGIWTYIFSSISSMTIPISVLRSKFNFQFISFLCETIQKELKSLKKHENTSKRTILLSLISFISNTPPEFWSKVLTLRKPLVRSIDPYSQIPDEYQYFYEPEPSSKSRKKAKTKNPKQTDEFCLLFEKEQQKLDEELVEISKAPAKAFVVSRRPDPKEREKERLKLEMEQREKEIREMEQRNREQKEKEKRDWDRKQRDRDNKKKREDEKRYRQKEERLRREREERERRQRERENKEMEDRQRKIEIKEKEERERNEREMEERKRREEEEFEKEVQEQKKREQEKLEQEQRIKEQLEKEQQEKEQREKEQREKEQLEKEIREKEQREKEQREKEQLEKEIREKEQKEKELFEKEQFEKEQSEKEQREKEQQEKEQKDKEQQEFEQRKNEEKEKDLQENMPKDIEQIKSESLGTQQQLKEQNKSQKCMNLYLFVIWATYD